MIFQEITPSLVPYADVSERLTAVTRNKRVEPGPLD